MKKIIQLDEYDYNKLVEKAKMTEKQIQDGIKTEIDKINLVNVKISLDCGNNWNDEFRITANLDYDIAGYHRYSDDWQPIRIVSYDQCRKAVDRIHRWMTEQISERYGMDAKIINSNRNAYKNRWKWYAFFIILSASGWAAAITTWLN